ncbi:hypothetical protein SAMN03159428_04890 [Kosakonia radicincitans]|uniref:Uncharacterized protein n=1 Tax=Kosakonia radicincitans TaxID=283686 RepID=A0AAX2EZF1_9ENTR|nr:hypothetical protein [Kosakonia radicincitans]SFF37598.1 hypothetical protein SAMN03159468_04917 [Kosakonia radicincitans]SFR26150.1 hypothetical protein SAMN03159514_04877 [Kosakonia radicincitans]SFU16609.1 hypothetical protein SAMN03159428_04890 [Kosakonia radicincitans]SFY31773.1 hypothetical protein SAMN03159436_04867 [Kosakonia radicincitans]
MAAVDPIHFTNAINLFSQLSETQSLNCYLFATGANYQEISELRGKSPVSIKKTLEKAQSNLELFSVQSIRLVFLTRIMFNTFYLIRCGKKRGGDLRTDIEHFGICSRDDGTSIRLFPELDIGQSLFMCMFCSGEKSTDLCEGFGLNQNQIQREIDTIQKRLNINSLQTLRIVVLARLEAYLAQISTTLDA